MCRRASLLATAATCSLIIVSCRATSTELSSERLVFQTDYGDLELAFYPKAAPLTVAHILALAKVGSYNTNHFFRVDKGFVAQTADVTYGRSTPPNSLQKAIDEQRVPLEVHPDLKHDRRGLLSMARHSDPNSGGSSFSIMLNPAPHLNMEYTVFGEVTKGIEVLAKFEEVETVKEGIFVMPKERVQIHSTYVYEAGAGTGSGSCQAELEDLRQRFNAQAVHLQQLRTSQLP